MSYRYQKFFVFVFYCFIMFYYFDVRMFVVGYFTYFLLCSYALPEIGLLANLINFLSVHRNI
jgi:hypothetical protein